MRKPGVVREWLSVAKMFVWLQEAPDESAYKRRMAIWLSYTGKIHAGKIAEILDVSEQAVWLWVSQYNRQGPAGLERKGRGGRRWGFMSSKDEAAFIKPLLRRARAGNPAKPRKIREMIEAKLDITVSMSYVYRLLRRQGWAEAIAQSRSAATGETTVQDFQSLSRPWARQ